MQVSTSLNVRKCYDATSNYNLNMHICLKFKYRVVKIFLLKLESEL